MDALTKETALDASDCFLQNIPPYPEHFQGKGIVICGGGLTYFTSAWVTINLLRHLGCTLPIQLWHLGPHEMDDAMRALVTPLGVECVDAWEVRKEHPVRILNGWELKPYALLHCPFQEVLLLDADNLAVVNPEFLFTGPQYAETGALFWPDFGRLAPTREIWDLCGVAYQDEPEFETGQLLVDKARCWQVLCLTLWYNEHSDFYYHYIHGDKETFHLAFRKPGQPYSMPRRGVSWHADFLRQHDFDGSVLFEHQVKWDYYLGNGNDHLTHAALCQSYLEELRQKWDGQIHPQRSPLLSSSEALKQAAEQLTRMLYCYDRVGYDAREMTFSPGGLVDQGSAECETRWALAEDADGQIILEISSETGVTCCLRQTHNHVYDETHSHAGDEWQGQWVHSEQMPVTLTALSPLPEENDLPLEQGLPQSGRRAALLKVLTEMDSMGVPRPVIVEIGSLRDARPSARDSDGWSTLLFGWYAASRGAEFHTVDNSEFTMKVCQRVTQQYEAAIQYHVEDGLAFLKGFPRPIDLLYLDAWDLHEEGSDAKLQKIHAALAHKPALIVLDDSLDESGSPLESAFVAQALSGGYGKAFVQDGQLCLKRNLEAVMSDKAADGHTATNTSRTAGTNKSQRKTNRRALTPAPGPNKDVDLQASLPAESSPSEGEELQTRLEMQEVRQQVKAEPQDAERQSVVQSMGVLEILAFEARVFSRDLTGFADVSGENVLIHWAHGFGDLVQFSSLLPWLSPANRYWIAGDDGFLTLLSGNPFITPLFQGNRSSDDRPEGVDAHWGMDDAQAGGTMQALHLPPVLQEHCFKQNIRTVLWPAFYETWGNVPAPFHTKARQLLRSVVPQDKLNVPALDRPLPAALDFDVAPWLLQWVEARLQNRGGFGPRKLCLVSRNGYTCVGKNWGHFWREDLPEDRRREGEECRDFMRLLLQKDPDWMFLVMEDQLFGGDDTVRSGEWHAYSYAELFGSASEAALPFGQVMKALVRLADLSVGVPTGPYHLSMAHPDLTTVGIWTEHLPSWYDEPKEASVHLLSRNLQEAGMAARPGSFADYASLHYRSVSVDTRVITGAQVLEAAEPLLPASGVRRLRSQNSAQELNMAQKHRHIPIGKHVEAAEHLEEKAISFIINAPSPPQVIAEEATAPHSEGISNGEGVLNTDAQLALDYQAILDNAIYLEKLCFTVCLDENFIPGAIGTIRSIRSFYPPDEADIIVFLDREVPTFTAFCQHNSAELHYVSEIAEWVLPLVYAQPRYANDTTHFYHPDFRTVAGVDHHTDREHPGFDTIRHLHTLNVKAYCTGYCLCLRNYRRVVHIDADAFLLARIDAIFENHWEPDTVIGFEDGHADLENMWPLLGIEKPQGYSDTHYAFNAGIVFYVNGPGVRRLACDFMFYIESCYHFSALINDQGVLRALVAKHQLQGDVHYVLEEAVNWNPTWNRADELEHDDARNLWINKRNGQPQIIWHGAGMEKLWTGRYHSPSVNAAWKAVGGVYRRDWQQVKGSVVEEHCRWVAARVGTYFGAEPPAVLNVLEIGTQYGRTAIAFCALLMEQGFTVHMDTCDIFSPSLDYPQEFATQDEVLENIRRVGLEDYITSHHVQENESLPARFGDKRFDFIYVDGCHEFKQVVADCVVALRLCKPYALIIGDDFQLSAVREAVYAVFAQEAVVSEQDQWLVAVDQADKDATLMLSSDLLRH